MHLVRLIVARENMPDQVNAKPIGDLALPLARKAAPDGEQGRATLVDSPSGGPIVSAYDHRRHVVVEVTERHASDLLGIFWRRFNPDVATDKATWEILQQIERARQHVI